MAEHEGISRLHSIPMDFEFDTSGISQDVGYWRSLFCIPSLTPPFGALAGGRKCYYFSALFISVFDGNLEERHWQGSYATKTWWVVLIFLCTSHLTMDIKTKNRSIFHSKYKGLLFSTVSVKERKLKVYIQPLQSSRLKSAFYKAAYFPGTGTLNVYGPS